MKQITQHLPEIVEILVTYFSPIFFTANPKSWKISTIPSKNLTSCQNIITIGHWSSPNTQTIEEARTHKLLSYIYVDQVTNVPCSFFPQSAVDDNGYVPLVDAKDRLHHKHDPKTPPRMCLRLRGGHREVLNSTQNSGRSQLYWYIQAQFFMDFDKIQQKLSSFGKDHMITSRIYILYVKLYNGCNM